MNSYTINTHKAIDGLYYIPGYILMADHDKLIHCIDDNPWSAELKRRVQHYGYRYDYKKRLVDKSMRIGDLPLWLYKLATRLCEDNLKRDIADQVIINEYLPGQGISSHIDCIPCFDDTIISLSLGSHCIMNFTHIETGVVVPLLLEPCSLVVMRGESRYLWKHGITGRKIDIIGNMRYDRSRRISLTFRNVTLH